MIRKSLRWQPTAIAIAAGLTLMSTAVQAQQSSGSINGRAAKGDAVVVEDRSIGITRQARVADDGSFVISQLPPGTYQVTITRANGTKQTMVVVVQSGEGSTAFFGEAQRIEVVGSAIRRGLDVKSVESVQVFSKAELDRLPVARDATAIALLAPTAVFGDSRIGQTGTRNGNVPSLGGASPAENAYYINGFNVTNLLNGVAFNQVPFEAVAEQQVKIGGYGAEFGRSMGGVVIVTTKRGTNEWHGGGSVTLEPRSLKGASVYTVRDPATPTTAPDNSWLLREREGGTTRNEVNVWGGGPLIQDKLFAFVVVKAPKVEELVYARGVQTKTVNDTPQYLLKLDWNVSDKNLFELTAFSDKNKDRQDQWQQVVEYGTEKGAYRGTTVENAGGQNVFGKWTTWLTNDLSVSALAGVGKFNRNTSGGSGDCPVVIDRLSGVRIDRGCWTLTRVGAADAQDERKAYRIDAEWALNSQHTLKFGLDHEKYSVVDGTRTPGEGQYQVRVRGAGFRFANGYVLSAPTQVVEFRKFENGGAFTTNNAAWYVEDAFQVTPRLLLTLGLRNESFNNKNADGKDFIKIKNTWAPRIGAAWDVNGNADLKVYGNLGRYYIPVMMNTNVRLSGREFDYSEFYLYGGSFSNDIFQRPALGAQLGTRAVVSDGKSPDPRSVVDSKIKPLFQDEFIVGFQKALANNWKAGLKYTHRKLGSGMDDICNDEGPTAWALANGYTANQAANIGAAIGHCFLYNPGNDLNANIDIDGTGTLSPITIPASALMMPKAKRTYDALEFTLGRTWDKKWSFEASYVLAFSKGNTEGYVKSDIGQDDAGISQDFDYPGLMEGAEGFLPNDRRHTLKLWGSYQVTDEWRFGVLATAQSGRPKNCFGPYEGTLDGVSILYGDASFWCEGKLNKRGSLGRTPWTHQINLQATYTPAWQKGLVFNLDVINLLGKRGVRGIDEQLSAGRNAPTSTYGAPLLGSLQPPTTFRFTGKYEF